MSSSRKRAELLANALSFSRIPMAALIWVAPARPAWTLSLVGLAALTDVLDGWVARRGRSRAWAAGDKGAFGASVARGEYIDGLADKLFIVSAVAALIHVAHPPWYVVGAFLAREILFLPVMVAYRLAPLEFRKKVDFTAGPAGKATTFAQAVGLGAGFLGYGGVLMVASFAAGAFGLVSVLVYVGRALGRRNAQK